MEVQLLASYKTYLDKFIQEHDFCDEDELFWSRLIDVKVFDASVTHEDLNSKAQELCLILKINLSQSDSSPVEELFSYFLSNYLVWKDKQKELSPHYKFDVWQKIKAAGVIDEWLSSYEEKLDLLLNDAAAKTSTKSEVYGACQQLKSQFISLKVQPEKEPLGKRVFLIHLLQFLPMLTRRLASISEYREKEVCEILLGNLSQSFARANVLREMIYKKREELSRFAKRLASAACIDKFYSADDLLSLGRLQLEAQEAYTLSNANPLLKLNIFKLCCIKFHEYEPGNDLRVKWTVDRDASLDAEVKNTLQKIWCSLGGSLNPQENSDGIPASPETLEQAQRYYELYVSSDLIANKSKTCEFGDLLEKAIENGVLSFLLDEVEGVVESRLHVNSTCVSTLKPKPQEHIHVINGVGTGSVWQDGEKCFDS